MQKSKRDAFILALLLAPFATMGAGEYYLGNLKTATGLMVWWFLGLGILILIQATCSHVPVLRIVQALIVFASIILWAFSG